MDIKLIQAQVVIIGAGAAGLRTAIELTSQGVDCLVLGKREHGDAHTSQAAGGINASLGSLDEEDDWTLHGADTLREGHFICDPVAVELLARRAPERIRELATWGCPFDRTEEGAINQRYFGAQSFRRTCFVGDRTGEAVLETLVERAKELEVPYRQNVFITKILTEDGRALGALGWDMETGEALVFSGAAVVLAAGGCTALYKRSSSRPGENTGDATALALAAGAGLRDMEFIQFHPTGMVSPEELVGKLVTEAVRGEGARLTNTEGERFMERYAPEQMELSARDVVARAIAEEVSQGRGTKRNGVYLDISHRDREFIQRRLPRIYDRFMDNGVDIANEPMEVAPTAHYAMGGVKVDFRTGKTDVEGLFAVGESTAGVHGANRLGGNSLAETVVFGEVTGAYLAGWVEGRERPEITPQAVRGHFEELEARCRQHGSEGAEELIEELGELLEARAGIVRTKKGVAAGIEELAGLRERAKNLKIYTRPGSTAFVRMCNLDFMLDTAEVLVEAARMREESRGAHFREDFAETRPRWKVSLVGRRDEKGALTFERVEVGGVPAVLKEALEREVELDYHHLE